MIQYPNFRTARIAALAAGILATACRPSAPEPDVAWPIGETRTHRLRLDARLMDEGGGAPLLAYEVTGDWHRTAVERTPPYVRVVARLDDVTLRSLTEDPEAASALAEAQRDLETPIGAVYDESGALHAVRTPRGLGSFAAGVLEGVLSLTQVVRPPTDAEVWAITEHHSDGRVQVRYARTGPRAGTREKVRYEATLDRSAPVVVASTGAFVLDEAGRVRSTEVRETLRQADHPSLGPLEALTAVQLADLVVTGGATPDEATAAWSALAAIQDRPIEAPRVGGDRRLRDRAAVRGRSLSQLRQAHTSAVEADDALARADAFAGLAGLLALQDDAVAAAGRAIAAGEPDAATLITALGTGGSPAAQELLRALYADSPLSDALRDRSLIALQRAPEPAPATVALYEELLSDPRAGQQAAYALGTAAARLRPLDPAAEAHIVEVLGAQLGPASTEDARVNALRGLANAGGRLAWSHVAPHLDAPEVRVREAAVDALHAVPGPEAEARLVDAARPEGSEGSIVVRRAAVSALRRRPPTPPVVDALRAASTDEEYTVRVEAVRALSEAFEQVPGLRPDLQRIAETESRPEIAKIARQALRRADAATDR